MIRGIVSEDMRPTITLELRDSGGDRHAVAFEIDTAFTHALTLPLNLVPLLGLEFIRSHVVEYANGGTETVEVYEVALDWDGHPISEEVFALGHRPLLGTRLLDGYDLSIRFLPGGEVTVRAVEDQ